MLYAIVALLLLLADQGMKYWTTTHVALDVGKQTLLPGLIDLRNIHNSGSAFSFLGGWSGARWLFLAVTVLFAVLVILALRKKVIRGGFGRWTALIVLAGALGNAIDRGLYGYVIDMFEFAFFPSFPVFNVADICITVCGVLFCIYVLVNKEPFGAAADEMRPGPGGSMTRTAPRKVEKKEREKRVAAAEEAAAPVVREAAPAPVKAESAPAPAPVPAKAAEPVPEEKKEPRARRRRSDPPEKTERDLKFEALKRPVVTHESFLEMTRRMPGEDPFAEWTAKAAETPVRTVEPEEPTRILVNPEPVAPAAAVTEEPTRVLPKVEAPAPAAEEPAMEAFDLDAFFGEETAQAEAQIYAAAEAVRKEAPAPAAEVPAPAEVPVPEEVAAVIPETPAVPDADADPVYSLEDILNEFRDL